MTRVIVLSDLHLAVPGPLNNFHAGDALADFLAEQARPDTTCVIAGDGFDFLQIDGRSSTLHSEQMPTQIQQTLDALVSLDWGRRFFAALSKLLACGGRCIVLPGNHDPELVHPCFAEKLLAASGLPTHHPGLLVHPAGPWRTQVGAREVIIGHGHRGDAWNDIAPETVQNAIAGEHGVLLPPGSRLVTDVLNVFKQQRTAQGELRFPFVDLLKPEMPAVPLLLLYLDRTLAMGHLGRALDLSVQALALQVGKWLRGTAKLAAGPSQEAVANTALDDMAQALAQTYSEAQRKNPARCVDELIEWLESDASNDAPMREGLLATHGGMRARMLRAFLWLASDEGRFFDRSYGSADDRRIIKDYLPAGAPPRVVIAGHTHAARQIQVSSQHLYLNTGTWTDLIAFPSVIDDGAIKTWIDQLEQRQIPRLQRLTWAEVTPEYALLHDAAGIGRGGPTAGDGTS